MTAISSDLWTVPGSGGHLRYFYVPGRSAGFLPEFLVYEPELEVGKRLVLRANGDIVTMTSADLSGVPGRIP